jgi:cytochrome c553
VHGARLYTACVSCHGREGGGQSQGDMPVIAGQLQVVVAKQLVDYLHAERWDLQMEAVVATHRLNAAQDIADLSAYVAALPRKGGAGIGNGRNLADAAALYARDCAGCHGAAGEGNALLLAPRLAGQHYRYLLRQLHDTVEERRPNMPAPHPQLFGPLDAQAFTSLADYLSRQAPRMPARSPAG